MTESTLVQPQGRLDALGAQTLWTDVEPLMHKTALHVLVDMSEVRYISSDGLRVLCGRAKQ